MGRVKPPKFKKLKGYLSENEITNKELGKLIDRSTATISRKISGEKTWSWDEMVMIKNLLDLDDEIFMSIFFKE